MGDPAALLLFAAILWTHTRAALIALVAGIVLLAIVRRSWRPAALLGGASSCSRSRSCKAYDHFGPRTHFTAQELHVQEQIAKQHPEATNDATR